MFYKTNKNDFLFCIVLTYLYLCHRVRPKGKSNATAKMPLPEQASAEVAVQFRG